MKKSIYCSIVVCLALAFLAVPLATSALAGEPALKMVGNGTIKSALLVDGSKIPLSGRTSIYLEATEKELAEGILSIKGLNLAFFQVPQAALTYDKIADDRTGALGFALDPGKGPQYVRYNMKTGMLEGELEGYMDADYMADYVDVPEKGEDYLETPKQAAKIAFRMQLSAPLTLSATKEDVVSQKGSIGFELVAAEEFRSDAKAFELAMELTPIGIDTSILWYYEIAKRIKIQPVRIGRIRYVYPRGLSFSYTGAGLNFGMPQVIEQWQKADVVVSVNDWMTVWNSSYWIFDETEATALKAQVNVEDAVEIFFVYDFSPESMWGGGGTWGLGSANSKIITSDGNARGGIDFTHLAHELGHAIGLPHPNGSPGVSTGTLMCPSGWMNDNPQINSQENKENVSNPLFTFAFKRITAGPDCTDSADCGPCF